MNPPSPARRRQATLSFINLYTGHAGRVPFPARSSDLSVAPYDGDVAAFAAWLGALATTPKAAPWAPDGVAPWNVHATAYQGALVLTLENVPSVPGPLQVGIALHVRHGLPLWRVLTALPGARVAGHKPPPAPWYAWVGGERAVLDARVNGFILQCVRAWATRPGRRTHRRSLRDLDGSATPSGVLA